MKNNREFTIQLANGRERSFESAAAMVDWMERQSGPRKARKQTQSPRRPKPSTSGATVGATNGGNLAAPLARYAERAQHDIVAQRRAGKRESLSYHRRGEAGK